MALLQGFEEINMTSPTGKIVMTVTDSAIRFNKATAAALGYAPFAKILINKKTKQIALQGYAAKKANAVKFSKTEDKQKLSVTIKDAVLLGSLLEYFKLDEAEPGEVAYQSVIGTAYPEEKVVVFNIADATAGTMKRRGRKKVADAEETSGTTEGEAETTAE